MLDELGTRCAQCPIVSVASLAGHDALNAVENNSRSHVVRGQQQRCLVRRHGELDEAYGVPDEHSVDETRITDVYVAARGASASCGGLLWVMERVTCGLAGHAVVRGRGSVDQPILTDY